MSGIENRQVGVLSLVYREASPGKYQVFVMDDVAKSEVAAGTPFTFGQAGIRKFNTFAGGREGDETRAKTLRREYQEEAAELLGLMLFETGTHFVEMPDDITPADEKRAKEAAQAVAEAWIGPIKKNITTTSHQPEPMIVAQQKPDKKIINEMAVGVVHTPFAAVPNEVKTIMRHAVVTKHGRWLDLAELYATFEALRKTNEGEVEFEGLPLRPQFLTAAAMFYLEKVAGYSAAAIRSEVGAMNQQLVENLLPYATQNDLAINNGTMTEKGRVTQDLEPQIVRYLGGKQILKRIQKTKTA